MHFSNSDSTANWRKIPSLSAIIEALQSFQDFEPLVRNYAIALHSLQLAQQYGWSPEAAELHLHRISRYLEVL